MDEIRFQDPNGPEAVYGINPLRAPVKTLLGPLPYPASLFPCPFAQLSLLPITAQGLRGMESLRRDFDHTTVAQWWAEARGTKEVLER